jgi:hypothetical protein
MSDPLMGKPAPVVRAILRGDHQALSNMSRAGHKAKMEKKKREQRLLQQQAVDEVAEERNAAEFLKRQISANEHIISVSTYD